MPEDLVAQLYRIPLLWASPPCQPWSKAGKRLGSDDDRDGWIATLHAVARLRPHFFIGENVPGVQGYLDAVVVPVLRALGYCVEYRVLDVVFYGVPQRRSRVFLVAGPVAFRWPTPTHANPAKLGGLLPWRTMEEALGLDGYVYTGMNSQRAHGLVPVVVDTDQPSPTVRAQTGTGFTFEERAPGQGGRVFALDRPAPTLTGASSDGGGRSLYVMGAGFAGRGRPRRLDQPSPAITAKGTAEMILAHQLLSGTRGEKGQVFKGVDEPAYTVSTAGDLYLAGGEGGRRRRLTPGECAILQDFPSGYPWKGSKTAMYRQIGNAVPRSMVRALVARVVELLSDGHRMPLPAVGHPPSVARFFPCPPELGGCGAEAGEACRGRAWGQHRARRALAGLDPYPSGTSGGQRRQRTAQPPELDI